MKNQKRIIALLGTTFILTLIYSCFILTQMIQTENNAKEISAQTSLILSEPITKPATRQPSTVADKVHATFAKTADEFDLLSTNSEFNFTEADKALIAKVVQAEAGNQDAIGKRLVADCIINRIKSDRFPNTVRSVIYQEGAFATPSESFCKSDIEIVEQEIDSILDSEVIYFRTDRFHTIGTPLYQHGDHYFSGI